jgi:putative acyl-CoA dehydrogenase
MLLGVMVPNQSPPLSNYNLFTSDEVLQQGIQRECAGWAEARLKAFGAQVGSEEAIAWGFQANENPPVLKTHDRFGNRIDAIEFHPAWHNLMRLSMAAGIHNLPWTEPQPGAHVARAALMFLASQNEQGHTCPLSMTYASVPALRREPAVAALWEPRLRSNEYKRSILIGMAMTEKQGGSDVRANTTSAETVDAASGEYRVNGHKWFCSAPMSDAFLILAQAPRGLTCFLLPRVENGFHIQRLKSKLGNRSNASGEVEFDDSRAFRIGDEGRGVPTIIDMVQHTRLDCVIGSAALMRQALTQAIHHARHRSAFGKLLIHQPLMRNVLADLALETEAATVLMLRLARAFDGEPGLARLATALAKYWVCKRAPAVVGEALECLGGNGYVEECVMPRLYRESPINSIWEGSGNVICLDILRAIAKEPASLESVLAEIHQARGVCRRFDAYVDGIDVQAGEGEARRLAEMLATALQASLLLRFSPPFVSDAFCATRLGSGWGRAFGTLPGAVDIGSILNRALPAGF